MSSPIPLRPCTDPAGRAEHGHRQCHRLLRAAHQHQVPLHRAGVLGGGHGVRVVRRAVPAGVGAGGGGRRGTSRIERGAGLLCGHRLHLPHRHAHPPGENPHEVHMVEELKQRGSAPQLQRTGLLMALAIAIHNFPEGIATFTSAYVDPGIAIPIAVAIAIHNIPEGIAVSVPLYYSTGNRRKAFWYSLSSGMAEPVGGLIGYFLLLPFITPFSLGLVMAAVAGIMVFISVDELIPAAERYGCHHYSIAGFVGGMAVMAASLLVI